MTVRQKRFVEEYLKTGIGKEAAINAGYSPRSAEQQASRLLAMPEVQAYRR
ncbi:MAG: terminase small subunit [Oscillospiraceae bacterium]|nr:terminase small subunit [Oscillospiraceae bacterium]